MTESSALSPPDFSGFAPDDIVPLEKTYEIGRYLMGSLGLDGQELTRIYEGATAKGTVPLTAKIVVKIYEDGVIVARSNRRSKDNPQQALLFPDPVHSAIQEAVVEVATDAVAQQAAELAVHAIAPVIVDTRERVEDVAKGLSDVAREVEELKAQLERATTGVVRPELPQPTPEPESPQPTPPADATSPPQPSKKSMRLSGRRRKGKSAFHNPSLRQKIIELFKRAHMDGHDGHVPISDIVRVADEHGYKVAYKKPNGKELSTLKDMIAGHIGDPGSKSRGGVACWYLTLRQIREAILLDTPPSDQTLSAAPPEPEPKIEAPLPEPQVAKPTDPEPTEPLSTEAASAPKKPISAPKKKPWRWPRTNAKVKTRDLLRRFPGLTKEQIYRWIAENKITSYAPAGGRVEGGHYVFLAQEVEKEIRRLLKESTGET